MMEFPVCIEAEELVQSAAHDRLCEIVGNGVNVTMPLEMRTACEKCGSGLTEHDLAYICSYECTFCAACTEAMAAVCPNCGGELVRRPTRGKVEEL
jgi:uncharacterized protein